MNCNCCNTGTACLARGCDVYPSNVKAKSKLFWKCGACGALVGCHPGTSKPLGTLADDQTRTARVEAHKMFDRLWKSNIMKSRSEAYIWLADRLNLEEEDCHIGKFDFWTCCRVVDTVDKFFDERRE